MIDFTAALITLSLYILIWEKLPYWGTWFNTLLDRSPRWLQTLYGQWRCAFCAAFWIALLLHLLPGLSTLTGLQATTADAVWPVHVLIIFLDSLSCATLVYIGNLLISAILAATPRGHELRIDYARKVSPRTSGEDAGLPPGHPSAAASGA
jgi:hypothetical protein